MLCLYLCTYINMSMYETSELNKKAKQKHQQQQQQSVEIKPTITFMLRITNHSKNFLIICKHIHTYTYVYTSIHTCAYTGECEYKHTLQEKAAKNKFPRMLCIWCSEYTSVKKKMNKCLYI